jgi:hypothetical protein
MTVWFVSLLNMHNYFTFEQDKLLVTVSNVPYIKENIYFMNDYLQWLYWQKVIPHFYCPYFMFTVIIYDLLD